MTDLTETFRIHNRINLYLLDAIDESHLADTALTKGRNVGKQWAHIHNVRLMWLKVAAQDLATSLAKIEDVEALTKDTLREYLIQSGDAIEQLFEIAASTQKIKGFKPHPTAFLGYLISHESHHRGQIILTLKQNGHMPDKRILFGLWEWGVR